MEIEADAKNYRFKILSEGARVATLTDGMGHNIFAPYDGSRRGGSHVCLPQFGPDAPSGSLDQHGFGRNENWRLNNPAPGVVEAMLEVKSGEYAGLSAHLTYKVKQITDTEAWFEMILDLQNDGERELRVAPGFHPYFATDDQAVVLDGKNLDLANLTTAIFTPETNHHELISGSNKIMIESENLPIWAVWTDNPLSYVCVEPTFAGNSFLEQATSEGEVLAPNQTRQFVCRIRLN